MTQEKKPSWIHPQFDWTISLGHIGSVLIFALGGIFAYTDLKSDVRALSVHTEGKFAEYDKVQSAQAKIDADQNERMVRIFTVLTEAVRDMKSDLRSDIRDLHAAVQGVKK